ncbi:TPA: hypothetical protein ACHK07_005031, partial [Escherichia coli]
RVLDPVGTFHIFSDNAFVNPELSNITGMAQEKGLADVICQQDVIFLKKYLFPGNLCFKRTVNKNNVTDNHHTYSLISIKTTISKD